MPTTAPTGLPPHAGGRPPHRALAFAHAAVGAHGAPAGPDRVRLSCTQASLARRHGLSAGTVAWYLRQLGPAVVAARTPAVVIDTAALARLEARSCARVPPPHLPGASHEAQALTHPGLGGGPHGPGAAPPRPSDRLDPVGPLVAAVAALAAAVEVLARLQHRSADLGRDEDVGEAANSRASALADPATGLADPASSRGSSEEGSPSSRRATPPLYVVREAREPAIAGLAGRGVAAGGWRAGGDRPGRCEPGAAGSLVGRRTPEDLARLVEPLSNAARRRCPAAAVPDDWSGLTAALEPYADAQVLHAAGVAAGQVERGLLVNGAPIGRPFGLLAAAARRRDPRYFPPAVAGAEPRPAAPPPPAVVLAEPDRDPDPEATAAVASLEAAGDRAALERLDRAARTRPRRGPDRLAPERLERRLADPVRARVERRLAWRFLAGQGGDAARTTRAAP